jgi:site-specific recombinase XerD
MDQLGHLESFAQYLDRRAPGRRTTINYVSDVRQFLAVCAKPWRDVTMHDMDAFVDSQRVAGLGPATVKRRVAALKVYFDFLAEESGDLSQPNPVRFKRHAGKQPHSLPRDLSDETIAQLWAVITAPRDQAWFALMWRAGLRVSEVTALKLTDVTAPAMAEQPARVRVCGKGQKERLVLLSADAYAVLASWLTIRPASAQPYVFLNDRGQPLAANGIEWLLHRYGAQAGVTVTPHQLRHTFARQVTEAGMPITSLGKLLGHAQVSTTQIYTAGADPALRQAYQEAMTRVEQLPLANPPPPPQPETAPPAPERITTPFPAPPALPDWDAWAPHLPTALRHASLTFVQRRVPNWKPRYQRSKAKNILNDLRAFWDWQIAQRPIHQLADLRLADLQAYQQARTAAGQAPGTLDRTLDDVLALVREQAEQGCTVDASVFRLRPLPRPDSLPRHLSEAESQRLEAYVRSRITPDAAPEVRLINASFFVLAHAGLRISECADLQYQDLDLAGQRLFIRLGKGHKDRCVYLSATACQALHDYLGATARAPAVPLWLKATGQPPTLDWLREQIAKLGAAVQITGLSPHRLRHTLATRLLNVGMDITRIQKLLGHQYISTTMIYARVHDRTVETDYRQAMRQIELQHLPLSDTPVAVHNWPIGHSDTHAGRPVIAQVGLDNSV